MEEAGPHHAVAGPHQVDVDLHQAESRGSDVHEIYTIKYSHIYIFSLTFMLFCD